MRTRKAIRSAASKGDSMSVLRKIHLYFQIFCLIFITSTELNATPKNTPAQVQKRVAVIRARTAAGQPTAKWKGSKLAIHNALKGYRGDVFKSPNGNVVLTKEGLAHILQRHHPQFWDRSVKAKQSFFNRKATVDDIRSTLKAVLAKNPVNTYGKFPVTYQGKKYEIALNRGNIGTFHPVD